MQNNAKLGGILSIVAGSIGIFGMLILVALAVFMAVMPGLVDNGFYNQDDESRIVFIVLAVVYGVMGLGGILVGVMAIVGGVFAMQKRRWAWSLAGAIAGNVLFPLCGIPAVIFVCLGKNEFGAVTPGAPPAPMQRIVG